jgi:hypothetical protein
MIGISCPLRIPARRLAVLVACLVSGQPVAGEAQIHDAPQALLRLEEFSPGLLGIYRKMMRIESDIVKYSREYDVDAGLAKAVCLYESGGNASLTSIAGAQGYFQVMPSTFRLMRVETNIEAGIKYLSSLVRQFGREDYALAGYNGGPTRVARGRAMPLESLQYVIGVGHYRSVLKAYEPSVRAHASQLNITTVRRGEDWWALSDRLNLPVVQLRLHNPFLAAPATEARRHGRLSRSGSDGLVQGRGWVQIPRPPGRQLHQAGVCPERRRVATARHERTVALAVDAAGYRADNSGPCRCNVR